MPDRGKQIDLLWPHTEGVAGRPDQVGIGEGQFQVGEFPEVRVQDAGRSLAHEEETAFLGDKSNESARRGENAPAGAGQLMNTALPLGGAVFRYRADAAFGLARRADESAEFHERLVELGTGA